MLKHEVEVEVEVEVELSEAGAQHIGLHVVLLCREAYLSGVVVVVVSRAAFTSPPRDALARVLLLAAAAV